MGIRSQTNPPRRAHLDSRGVLLLPSLLLAVCLVQTGGHATAQTATQATTVPLLLPGGLAYDSAGNLYFAETANHVIRRVSPQGILTTVAGTGEQGFAGDSGPAVSARLDSPAAIALDSGGNLYLADTHNHRIRRVDATTGIITTIAGTGASGVSPNGVAATSARLDLPVALAFDGSQNLYFADARLHVIRRIAASTGLVTTIAGNGIQGYSGDNGSALAASIDTPTGLAVDAANNLYLADTHNHRVRRVDAATGIISTIAGTGQPGFSADGATATSARIDLPRGLTLDASGNLFLVDALNHRIRRVDATTGQIATVAGNGTQAYAGDFGPAISAALNTPRAIALSPANLPTFSDTANQRIRQVDSAANIHTIAGLGTTTSATLALTGPSVALYGTGAVTATLAASPATGSITFFDTPPSATQPSTIATIPLNSNAASNPITSLAAGTHRLTATYQGDSTHAAAQSGTLTLSIAAAPATVTPASIAILYGQTIPSLTGTLAGVLPQDAAKVSLALATTALPLAPPAVYPITATLSGSAAGNYALTTASASVTIAKAPVTIDLASSLITHVATTTAGAPTGLVNLLDGATPYASVALTSAGDATFSPTGLSTGTHTLIASYAGDSDFLPAASAPLVLTIGSATGPDFTLATSSAASVTISPGNAATFSFAVNPVNGTLSSPILLTASGLPTGATASFNPAYLPPANTPAAFILTIQTPKTAQLHPFKLPTAPFFFAALIPLACLRKRRRVLLLALATLSLGCGDRVNNSAAVSPSARTYNITVLATATTTTGATLQHTAAVTLVVQ